MRNIDSKKGRGSRRVKVTYASVRIAGPRWSVAIGDRQGVNADKEPEIKPIILESNPVPRPPKSLGHLHFYDFITHVIAAVEAASAQRGA